MTLDGQMRRTPGGVFFRLVKEYVAATDKTLDDHIFGARKRRARKKSKGQGQKSVKKPAPPRVEPLVWSQALQYANESLTLLLKDQRKSSMSARHLGYAYMVMGDVIAEMGESDAAADYFEKGFFSFNEVYGSQHPKTLEAKTRLNTERPEL